MHFCIHDIMAILIHLIILNTYLESSVTVLPLSGRLPGQPAGRLHAAWPAACAVPASLSWSAHGLSTEDHGEQQQKHFGAVVRLKRTIKLTQFTSWRGGWAASSRAGGPQAGGGGGPEARDRAEAAVLGLGRRRRGFARDDVKFVNRLAERQYDQ